MRLIDYTEKSNNNKVMSEKDKMLAGELYDANYNIDLEKEREQAKDL